MDFTKVDRKYRPIPFWSWNEKLDTEETRRQVRLMNDAGLGGFFMHARGGLLTEYMSEEWFDNVEAACDEGNKLGIAPWAYDENGWPSGFGGGKVNGLGVDYQQKSLHVAPAKEGDELLAETVVIKDGYRYYYTVNEFYVDTLDKNVTERFIDEIYKKYRDRFGNKFVGFFTDEPQVSRTKGYPWSFPFVKTFEEKYGYSLIEHIDELFFEKGDYVKTRVEFWKLVTDLFSANFFKPIYDFCIENGYEFTGHLACEDNMASQLTSNGAAMPHYEYFTIPGIDWLGRNIYDCLNAAMLGSAAAQLGKKQALSESFALAGHNVSHAELKRIYEWQMVRGINLLCTHLEGYSLRGIRKRDYPPAMYYQQPWWDDMDKFFESMSRVGKLLAEGKVVADTLVMQVQSSAWALYNGYETNNAEEALGKINRYNQKLLDAIRTLEDKHILFHLGDETLMERHGRVEGKELVIGEMRYKRVVIPEYLTMLPSTKKLLDEFREAGGIIITPEEITPNPITEPSRLTYTKRVYPDFDVHYFVNSDNKTVCATFSRGNLVLDIDTGRTSSFYGSYKFAPYESLVLIDTHEPRELAPASVPAEILPLDGEWRLKSATYNSITLDRCDWSMDDGEIFKDGYVLDILPRVNELRRPVRVYQRYRFEVECVPEEIFLCTETPEMFEITVNGTHVPSTVVGDFRDSSFKLVNIAGLVNKGENVIELRSTVAQRPETYEHLENSWAFESMKNTLSYDEEIEQIYLVGHFGAQIKGKTEQLPCDAYGFDGTPVIVDSPVTVDIENLDMSGFAEFAGEIVLEKTLTVDNVNKYVILKGTGMNSVSLTVNGKQVATKLYPPYRVNISEYLKVGENTLEVRILNNLRNMQGPFHHTLGEEIAVTPVSFYREANVFAPLRHNNTEACHDKRRDFLDRTCLVHFGMRSKEEQIAENSEEKRFLMQF